jgi:calcyphosin
LEKLRAELAQRGARGMVGLQRKFRIIDDDGDRALSIGEFNKAMNECNLKLSEEV